MKGPAGLTTGALRGRRACGGRRAQSYVVWTRPSSQESHRWGWGRGAAQAEGRAGRARLSRAAGRPVARERVAGTDTLSAPRQRCSHCTRLGASIPCRSPGCARLYHFPCATASGSFLSMKTLQLLCPEHSEGAAHLGKKSCPLALGQMRGQVCPRGFVLCTAPSVCPTEIGANLGARGLLACPAYRGVRSA